ncbi:lysM and putative peptidoglycan-binding domain-containing protein 4 [Hyla sarda]|uniref:lysM and putative peptidoglycan-binding domain-containing protein 4 n=1 Tax=Hyla sarda TaxID=327740 RepID=UPI0024C2A6E3|nr:lysM and putative peptidoglycan-binding domain-containing protein 4 [Hyla sarda]XP_056425218.1 lysM and putative peptidoglycan-binding domain-containing protein 4 [Hyla sarda]
MRLKKEPSHSFHPPTTIHSSRGSHVYTFTNGSADLDSFSEDELDVTELRARGGELHRQTPSRERVGDIVLLEHNLTENDNLNKLALQYGCKVADIKRINNFLTEQDMYALKTIKIPVKVHSVLTERYEEASAQGPSEDSIDVVVESGDEASVTVTENRDITQYFREIDQNIEAAAQNQELFSESLDLGTSSHQLSSILAHKDPSLGADWGIRWWNAVFIMLLIGIVLPVFYILYYETWKGQEQLHSASAAVSAMPNTSRDLAGQIPRPLHYAQRPFDTGG